MERVRLAKNNAGCMSRLFLFGFQNSQKPASPPQATFYGISYLKAGDLSAFRYYVEFTNLNI